jgi:hypothetical protein
MHLSVLLILGFVEDEPPSVADPTDGKGSSMKDPYKVLQRLSSPLKPVLPRPHCEGRHAVSICDWAILKLDVERKLTKRALRMSYTRNLPNKCGRRERHLMPCCVQSPVPASLFVACMIF